MPGFRFRLEVVRRQRKRAVDMARRDVAVALRAVHEAEGRLGSLRDEIERTAAAQRESRGEGVIDTHSLARLEMYHGNLRRRREEEAAERDLRTLRLEERRNLLAIATKNLKAIEKLRDKQWSRYEQDRKRREDAAYDEVAVQQFLRLARKPASAVHSR